MIGVTCGPRLWSSVCGQREMLMIWSNEADDFHQWVWDKKKKPLKNSPEPQRLAQKDRGHLKKCHWDLYQRVPALSSCVVANIVLWHPRVLTLKVAAGDKTLAFVSEQEISGWEDRTVFQSSEKGLRKLCFTSARCKEEVVMSQRYHRRSQRVPITFQNSLGLCLSHCHNS